MRSLFQHIKDKNLHLIFISFTDFTFHFDFRAEDECDSSSYATLKYFLSSDEKGSSLDIFCNTANFIYWKHSKNFSTSSFIPLFFSLIMHENHFQSLSLLSPFELVDHRYFGCLRIKTW